MKPRSHVALVHSMLLQKAAFYMMYYSQSVEGMPIVKHTLHMVLSRAAATTLMVVARLMVNVENANYHMLAEAKHKPLKEASIVSHVHLV